MSARFALHETTKHFTRLCRGGTRVPPHRLRPRTFARQAGDSGPGAIYGFESEGTSERQSQEAKAERMVGRPIGQYRMHLMWWHLAACATRASCFFQGETPDFWWRKKFHGFHVKDLEISEGGRFINQGIQIP